MIPIENPLLSKEEFVKVINHLKEATELQDKVNQLFRNSRDNIENDNMNAASLQISHESTVVKLLEKIMGDNNMVWSDIEYFIYELDYGKRYKQGSVTDADGKEIDFSTAEKLYDYLTTKN